MEDSDGNINLKNLSLHQANNEEEGTENYNCTDTVIVQIINEYSEAHWVTCNVL